MLRVGLTGQLGSGKTTVAAMLAARGAIVLSADEIGRRLMQPGQAVYEEIVAAFGESVRRPDGSLDRPALARLAFSGEDLLRLNAIVHPAVIAAQQQETERIAQASPDAVVVVESALIFEVERDARLRGAHAGDPLLDWRNRFDRVVLVTAPEEAKIERFVARQSAGRILSDAECDILREDARRRMQTQIPDAEKIGRVDYVLRNSGNRMMLDTLVERLWHALSLS